jgi:acetyl esterase/lipase
MNFNISKPQTIVNIAALLIVTCSLIGFILWKVPSKELKLPLSLVARDVTYCTFNDTEVKMDIYIPITIGSRPSPALVYVHGGAWIFGDKKIDAGEPDIPEFLSRGYVVATVNYRLAPEYKFPTQIEDVKCAVRYLRANAEKYNIDPNSIGAWGDSAGGHLVSLLALTNRSAGFDVGEYLEYSSSIQAVVDYFGPTNLTNPNFYNIYSIALDDIFGSYDNMINASPVKYVTKDSPPFLIVQGDRDMIVFQSQSKELYNKLIANNVTATLVIVKGASHSFVAIGTKLNPSRSEITKMVADFFDKYLKKPVAAETKAEVPYLLDYQKNIIYFQVMYKGEIDESKLGSPVKELVKEGWKIAYKDFPQHNTTSQRVTIE